MILKDPEYLIYTGIFHNWKLYKYYVLIILLLKDFYILAPINCWFYFKIKSIKVEVKTAINIDCLSRIYKSMYIKINIYTFFLQTLAKKVFINNPNKLNQLAVGDDVNSADC